MSIKKIPYGGKAASVKEQILALEEAGLLIKNKPAVLHALAFVGYYRLFSYVKPFIRESSSKISFEKVWDLYTFDRKLRLLAIDAIERIEVAFRVSISEIMSPYSPFWYTEPGHFKHIRWHAEFMDKVLQITSRQEHNLLRHFYGKYSAPDFPPSWIIIECLTFGTWSKIFDNLKKRSDKIAIANKLNIKLMDALSWIRALTELRNFCAHHERIWNQFFRHTPKSVPNESHQEHRFYQMGYIISKLLFQIELNMDWKKKLYELMQQYPFLPFEQMGFGTNWQNDVFWQDIFSS